MIEQYQAGKNVEHWRRIHDSQVSQYPSFVKQAGSVIEAAGRFVASGFATVTQEEHDRRRAICAACEHFDAAANRCRKCGCGLSVKPWMKAMHCPINRW